MAFWEKRRWWKTYSEIVAEFKSTRQPLPDEQFLEECDLPDNDDARHVALSMRRVFAETFGIDPLYLRGSDRGLMELAPLMEWDSFDLIEIIMNFEDELKVSVPDKAFASLSDQWSVRDVIMCVYLGRKPS